MTGRTILFIGRSILFLLIMGTALTACQSYQPPGPGLDQPVRFIYGR